MESEVIAKVCSKCRIEKSAIDFYKNRSRKDGLTTYCKSCVLERERKCRVENKEKIRQSAKKYYEKNKTKISKWHKENFFKNKEKILERNKKYAAQNKIKILDRNLRYRIELKNCYLIKLLKDSDKTLAQAPIPKSLVKLKREEIKIKRLIKEMTK